MVEPPDPGSDLAGLLNLNVWCDVCNCPSDSGKDVFRQEPFQTGPD